MSGSCVPLGQKWYKLLNPKSDNSNITETKIPRDLELQLKKEAEKLWHEDFTSYQKDLQKGSKRSEFKWHQTVIKSGALADKIAAHSLMINLSPVHALSSIAALVKIAQSKSKREYLMTIDRLKDLFIAELLAPRKLRYFAQSVVNLPSNDKERKLALILAYYEDQVKYYYKQFIEAVEAMSHDSVAVTKNSSINVMYHLLTGNPEEEALLLEKLVNKLGDPVCKIASHVVYLLKKLVTQDHPAMKKVVCTEVERLLFRPNCKEKAQYYAICFLQEVKFNKGDAQLANRLMEVYFGFFKKCIQQGDINNKLMLALLTGVSRTYPFSTIGRETLNENLETLFKMVHLSNVNIAIQVLSLIFVIVGGKSRKIKRTKTDKSGKGSLADRYYSTLYRFLLREELESTCRSAMFFNLIYRSLKKDQQNQRILAFVKRLLQIALSLPAQYAAAILFLISELTKERGLDSYFKKKGIIKSKVEAADSYDMNARNPTFANAHISQGLWELHLLMKHQHPSVALFARTLLLGQFIEYDGDVLNDFTVKNFLDRFVSRNPKKAEEGEGKEGKEEEEEEEDLSLNDDDDEQDEIGDSDEEDYHLDLEAAKSMDSDTDSSMSDELDEVLMNEDELEDDQSDDSLSLDEADFEDEIREYDIPLKKLKKVS